MQGQFLPQLGWRRTVNTWPMASTSQEKNRSFPNSHFERELLPPPPPDRARIVPIQYCKVKVTQKEFGDPMVPAERWPAHQLQQPMYSLTAVTLVQNEARWLPEWLEYHLLPAIAVDHFYVYDDDAFGAGSTDGLAATLAPYRGLVTLHRVSELGPLPTRGDAGVSGEGVSDMRMCSGKFLVYHRVGGNKCARNRFQFPQQPVAIRHAAATYGHRSRAMLLIDVDEFLMHTPGWAQAV